MSEDAPPEELEPGPAAAPDEEVEDGKIMAILAYVFWPLPFVLARENGFVLFHLRQAVLVLGAALGFAVLRVLVGFLPGILSWPLSCLCGLGSVAALVLAVLGIVYAAGGQKKELPLIGQYAAQLPF